MEYKLKRDLPFAKAGTEVIEIRGNGKSNNILIEIEPYGKVVIWVTELQRLRTEGWIEEVKPRVGWLAEDEDGGYKFYLHPKPIITNSWDKTSKWTEVIE